MDSPFEFPGHVSVGNFILASWDLMELLSSVRPARLCKRHLESGWSECFKTRSSGKQMSQSQGEQGPFQASAHKSWLCRERGGDDGGWDSVRINILSQEKEFGFYCKWNRSFWGDLSQIEMIRFAFQKDPSDGNKKVNWEEGGTQPGRLGWSLSQDPRWEISGALK